MSKKEQLRRSLAQIGIDLDQCQGGEQLTSKILEKVRGGSNINGCTHGKTPTHDKHDRVHSRHPLHGKCTHGTNKN